MPDVYTCDIVYSERLADSVFSITVSCPEIAGSARAGQFVSIRCGEERLLRRPISICRIDEDEIEFVFEVKGEGTRWLSGLGQGNSLNILGPLGNGYDIPDGKIIIVGGGIGAPPLLFAADCAKSAVTAVLGFRDSSRIILRNEFETICGRVIITTDDGSGGKRGTVLQPLSELLESGGYAAVLACGPRAMLSPVAEMCIQRGVSCQTSLEERMGCGVGACMVCACKTVHDGIEGMSRVCKDGPVFDAKEVAWE